MVNIMGFYIPSDGKFQNRGYYDTFYAWNKQYWYHGMLYSETLSNHSHISGVARAFPGGQVAHPEGSIWEENEDNLIFKKWEKIQENQEIWRKILILPTRGQKAGDGLESHGNYLFYYKKVLILGV